MTDLVRMLLVWSIIATFIVAGIITFVLVVNFGVSLLNINLNNNALSDVFKFVSVWLPFDLNVMLIWIGLATTAYFTYRFAVIAYMWVGRFLMPGSDNG